MAAYQIQSGSTKMAAYLIQSRSTKMAAGFNPMERLVRVVHGNCC